MWGPVIKLGLSDLGKEPLPAGPSHWSAHGGVCREKSVKGKDQREAFLGILMGTSSSSIMIIAANFIVPNQETVSK